MQSNSGLRGITWITLELLPNELSKFWSEVSYQGPGVRAALGRLQGPRRRADPAPPRGPHRHADPALPRGRGRSEPSLRSRGVWFCCAARFSRGRCGDGPVCLVRRQNWTVELSFSMPSDLVLLPSLTAPAAGSGPRAVAVPASCPATLGMSRLSPSSPIAWAAPAGVGLGREAFVQSQRCMCLLLSAWNAENVK